MPTSRRFFLLLFAPVFFFLSAPGIQAQENATSHTERYRLDEIMVTARGVPAPASLTPGGVGVITDTELARPNNLSVVEGLERIPGVSRSNDSPWSADPVIRGMTRDSLVVLVDGMRVNMSTDINGRFGLVPSTDIDRIEVLKGPISALYGAGALGGVVNIITKHGAFTDIPERHGTAGVSASSNPAGAGLSAALTYSAARFWITGSTNARTCDEYVDGDADRVENSQFSEQAARVSAGLKWNDTQQTRFNAALTTASDVGIPGTGTAPLPVGADVTLRKNTFKRFELRHSITPADGILREASLQLGYQCIDREPRIDNFPAGTVDWIEPSAHHETFSANWRNHIELENHALTLGLEAWNWHMTANRQRKLTSGLSVADKPTPTTTQRTLGLYAEDNWNISPDWILNVGGRIDQTTIVNDATPTVTAGSTEDIHCGGHLGLTHLLGKSWSLSALVATSHRSPSILERFKHITVGGGITEIGNPDLRPERSLFLETGARYSGATLDAQLGLFANFVDDLIVSTPRSATLFQMDNVASAEIFGAEATLSWQMSEDWKLFGDIAYTRGRDVADGEPLRFIPPLNGVFGIHHGKPGDLWWEAETYWATGQHETPDKISPSHFHALFNARLGYAFPTSGLTHELTMDAKNLFNRRHSNYLATSRGVELMEPGTSVAFSWSVHF